MKASTAGAVQLDGKVEAVESRKKTKQNATQVRVKTFIHSRVCEIKYLFCNSKKQKNTQSAALPLLFSLTNFLVFISFNNQVLG